MKIKDKLFYLNPNVWEGDTAIYDSGDLSILRTVSSYKLSDIKKIQDKLIKIGYLPCTKLVRIFFKYIMIYVRHIPNHQRITAYKTVKINENEKVVMIDDRVLYTDEDLLMQKEYKKHQWLFFREKISSIIQESKKPDGSHVDYTKIHKIPKENLVWWVDTENEK